MSLSAKALFDPLRAKRTGWPQSMTRRKSPAFSVEESPAIYQRLLKNETSPVNYAPAARRLIADAVRKCDSRK